MALCFRNQHNLTAYASVLLFDQACGSSDPFRKIGWYEVPPSGLFNVMNGSQHDLPFTYFAWFADVYADGPCWSGNRWYKVPRINAFNQCYLDDTGCDARWPF